MSAALLVAGFCPALASVSALAVAAFPRLDLRLTAGRCGAGQIGCAGRLARGHGLFAGGVLVALRWARAFASLTARTLAPLAAAFTLSAVRR